MRPKWSMTGGSADVGGRFWHMENLHEETLYNTTLLLYVQPIRYKGLFPS